MAENTLPGARRTFPGDDRPPARTQIPTPPRSRPASTPPSASAQGATAEVPGESVLDQDTEKVATYRASAQGDGGFRIYVDTTDGDTTDLGVVNVGNFRDVLDSVSEFDSNTGSYENIPEQVALSLSKQDLDLPDYMLAKYKQNKALIASGSIWTEFLRGATTIDDARDRADIETIKNQVNEAPLFVWQGSASESVGKMWKDLKGAGVAGAARRIAGETAGLAAFATDAPLFTAGVATMGASIVASRGATAPVVASAFAIALNTGAGITVFRRTFEIEGGNAAREMDEKGFDEQTIKKFAPLIGVVNGALEVFGFHLFTAPFRRAISKDVMTSAPMRKVLANAYMNYAKELGLEIAQEEAQEATNLLVRAMAAESIDRPDLTPTKEEIVTTGVEIFLKTAAGAGGGKLPGLAVEVGASKFKSATKPKALEIKKEKPKAKKEKPAGDAPAKVAVTPEDTTDLEATTTEGIAQAEASIAEEVAPVAIVEQAEAEGLDVTAVESSIAEAQGLVDAGTEAGVAIDTATRDLGASEAFVQTLKDEAVAAPSKEISSEKVGRGEALLPIEREANPDLAQIEDDIKQVNADLEKEGNTPEQTFRLGEKKSALLAQVGFEPVEKAPKGGILKFIRKITGVVKQKGDETITKLQAFRESLRDQAKAANAAVRMTRKDIAARQTALRKFIQESGLDKADKSKFLTALTSVQTQEQLARVLPEVAEKIEDLLQASAKTKLEAAVKKELKNVRPRRISGRQVGRFTPEAQEVLTRMRSAGRMTRTDAAKKLEANLQAGVESGAIPTAAEAYENEVLSAIAQGGKATVQEWTNLLQTIRALKGDASQANKLKRLNEEAKSRFRKKVALGVVKSKPKNELNPVGDRSADDTLFGWWNRQTSGTLAWRNLLNRISWNDKTPGINTGKLNQIADVSDAEIAEKRGIRIASENLVAMHDDAYGEMTEYGRETKWAEDSVRVSLGEFTNANGKKGPLEMSRAEARKKWMELQDPTLQETFRNKDAMAYTQEMVDAIGKFLTNADLKFAQAQLDFYSGYYAEFNGVYSDLNGVNLAFNSFYSPIVRAFSSKESLENQLLGEAQTRRALSVSAGKARVKNLRAIKRVGDVDAMRRHVQQVEHYKAWAKKLRQLNSIFGDGEVREAIDASFGTGPLRAIDKIIEDFTRGGIDRSRDIGWIDTLKTNYTVSVLALKPAIAVKQMVSFVALADSIPAKDFIIGLGEFMADMPGKVAILAESEVLKSRGINFTPETSEAGQFKAGQMFKLRPSVANMWLLMTKMGDRGAIYLGGWSVYSHAKKQGKTDAQAMRAFEDAFSSSQQSSDLSQLSEWQRGNSFQRLATAFLTSPMAYFRKEIVATESYAAGRIGKKEFAKQMFIYHFLLPMMFQFVADGMRFKVKDQILAGVLGSLNGIVILGGMLRSVIATALGLKPWASSTILDSLVREGTGAIRSIRDADEFDAETVLDIMKETSDIAGAVTGVPTKQAVNIAEGLGKMGDAETSREWSNGFKQVAGWSEYILGDDEEGE